MGYLVDTIEFGEGENSTVLAGVSPKWRRLPTELHLNCYF